MLKAGRVLVPNFQHRVMLGIGSFVGTLLLVGWVIINEPARMDVFTQQFQGRSIENGAATFISACATCHGADARGKAGVAPGLDNPMLFLKDNPLTTSENTLNDLNSKLQTAQGQLDTYNKDVKALADAKAQLASATAGSDQAKQAQTQIDALTTKLATEDQAKLQKAVDDLNAQIKTEQANHDALVKQGWEPGRKTRLAEVNWGGTLQNYLESTISGGRPVSSFYFPNPMPNWAQQFGGPLRQDEIQDVVAYIMNFQGDFQPGNIKVTPNMINQQFAAPTLSGAAPTPSAPPIGSIPAGTDPHAFVKNLVPKLPAGNADNGKTLYTNLGCAGCHFQSTPGAVTTGPSTQGTFTRTQNVRLKDSANADLTVNEYLAECILKPDTYNVPGYPTGTMPSTFATKLAPQDLADILAYLDTQK